MGGRLLDAYNASYAKKTKVITDLSSMFSTRTTFPRLQCTFSDPSTSQPVFSMMSNDRCENDLGLRFFGLLPCALVPILEYQFRLCIGRYPGLESDVSALIDHSLDVELLSSLPP